MGYEGEVRLQVLWWNQASAEKQLKVVVEEILAEARVLGRQEYDRCGRSEGGSEGGITDSEG